MNPKFITFVLVAFLVAQDSAQSAFPTRRLTPPQSLIQANDNFGDRVATAGSRVAVANPTEQINLADRAGTVRVYDAGSGRLLRTLKMPVLEQDAEFGFSLAMHGDLLAVGATGADSGAGAVFLYDLRNGKLLRKFSPSTNTGSFFGCSVAVEGELVAVGAFADNTNRGAVHVYNRNNGAELGKLTPSDAEEGDFFGEELVLRNGIVIASAPGKESGEGAVYLFNALSTIQIDKLTASDAVAGMNFGKSLSHSGNWLAVGAPRAQGETGAVYLFDLTTGQQIVRFLGAVPFGYFGKAVALRGTKLLVGSGTGAPGKIDWYDLAGQIPSQWFNLTPTALLMDGYTSLSFGHSLALGPDFVVTGAPDDAVLPPPDDWLTSGAAYVIRDFQGLLPSDALMAKGASSSLLPFNLNRKISRFGSVAVSRENHTVYYQAQSSPPLRNDLYTHWSNNIIASEPNLPGGTDVGGMGGLPVGARIRSVGALVLGNGPFRQFGQFSVSGAGVTTRNNQTIFTMRGAGLADLVWQAGVPQPFLGQAAIAKFGAAAQAVTGDWLNGLVLMATLARQTPSVTRENDSALLMWQDGFPVIEDADIREGAMIDGSRTFGQLNDRVSIGKDKVFFSGYAVENDISRPALFQRDHPAAPEVLHMRDEATPVALRYSQFLAETASHDDHALFYVTLKRELVNGFAVNQSNDLMLLSKQSAGATQYVAQRGTSLSGAQTNDRFKKLLGVWPLSHGRALLLCQVSGEGVNAGNDVCLWFFDANGPDGELLREGDMLGGMGEGAAVRTIQRVDADPDGRFVVLVALSGSPSRNQALLIGDCVIGSNFNEFPLRKPVVVMRKGDTYNLTQSRKLRGFNLASTLDRTGAGGGGRRQIINQNGEVAAQMLFNVSSFSPMVHLLKSQSPP